MGEINIPCPICGKEIIMREGAKLLFCPYCSKYFKLEQYEELKQEGQWKDESIRGHLIETLKDAGIPFEEAGKELFLPCPICRRKALYSFYEGVVKCKCGWEVSLQTAKEIRAFPVRWFVEQFFHTAVLSPSLEKFLGLDGEIYIPPLAKDLTRYLVEIAETYPPFAEISAIAILGALYAPFLEFNTLFEEYQAGRWDAGIALIAPSGIWHKSALWKAIHRLLADVAPNYLKLARPYSPSQEGILDMIKANIEDKKVVSFLWTIDEMGAFFGSGKEDYRKGNISLLLSLLEGTPFEHPLRRIPSVYDPQKSHFTILAASTFAGLQRGIDIRMEIDTGFLGRWLIYLPSEEALRQKEEEDIEKLFEPMPSIQEERKRRQEWKKSLQEKLTERAKTLEKRKKIWVEPSAEGGVFYQKWRRWIALLENKSPYLGGWLARLPYYVMKIASVFAAEEALEKDKEEAMLEEWHLRHPIKLALTYWVPSYIQLISLIGKPILSRLDKLYSLMWKVLSRSLEMPWSEFLQRFSPRGYTADEVKETLMQFVGNGLAEIEETGRKTIVKSKIVGGAKE